MTDRIHRTTVALAALTLLAGCAGTDAPAAGVAEELPSPEAWSHWGGDPGNTRSSPLGEIDAGNFENLEVVWTWRADNYGPSPDFVYRATPIYADGTLYTVAGSRRAVVAIDPATGETLWVWRMPHKPRWELSPRQNYGKSVHYEVVDGRGVILITTPGFHLVALEADTGLPVKGWGRNGDGIVDLLDDLGDYPFDPWEGLPPEVGDITTSSAPIVVNGVVIVPSTGEQGYYQTRKENVPSNILAYDVRSGKHLWRFDVIPRPGEYGHDTWEDGSWEYTGNIGSWAPISADLERGIVYIPTKAGTNDYYGGHRPGDGLFGTSLIALDARTGERIWHYQMVRHDIWNYDTPHAPQLVDLTVDGEEVPAVVQVTKQSFAYVFNRETGEPLWPFEYREVPQSDVPGERTSPVQPFPTRPAAFEMQGFSEDDVVDFTPELREQAMALLSRYRLGPLFNPPALPNEEEGIIASIHCPGANGGANIPGGSAVDPESGILYVASTKGCSAPQLIPGTEVDPDSNMDYVTRGPGGIGTVGGIPLFKPPYGRITAIDLNTGEHLWWIPNGDTPESIRNHPMLEGVDVGNTGQRSHATVLVTSTLLIYGEGRSGEPNLRAVDKATGEELARIPIPAPTTTAPMTYIHEGRQYIALPVAGGGQAARIVTLALPE
jgi:glucose dehydrogenase